MRRVRVPVRSRSTMTWHRRPAEGCVWDHSACLRSPFSLLALGLCGGDGRVLAVPAAGGRHGQLQCLAIGRTEHASAHHGALSVSLTARPEDPDGFIMAGCVHTPKLAPHEAQHTQSRARAAAPRTRKEAQSTKVFSHAAPAPPLPGRWGPFPIPFMIPGSRIP